MTNQLVPLPVIVLFRRSANDGYPALDLSVIRQYFPSVSRTTLTIPVNRLSTSCLDQLAHGFPGAVVLCDIEDAQDGLHQVLWAQMRRPVVVVDIDGTVPCMIDRDGQEFEPVSLRLAAESQVMTYFQSESASA